ncbi:CDP-alcohol phosphatidyltransferase family protein [Cohaesibacter celericrescens]|uniref:CDP-diacylglycerol--serine O-phosphatidyltransferase n=1 Tax=Cohaesibacter celericrescens TaxID=2067669 RepID=A0A2N5XQI1_9HYPH|nr:phosphatidylcholine/phosphatidylserine synthase [Cohaesibacter celericrescens]PLW76754.1 CDP-diacylglycerol--serine O-phosphatidyltransferase [Cohaesibacter celericrescens]
MDDEQDHGLTNPFQPFEPEENSPKQRFKAVPFRLIAPNLVTLMALCAGLTGVRMAIEGRFEMALISLFAAAFLDGVDGRVARMLKGTSRFGAELDSLTDFVNFGVAPPLILHIWILNAIPSIGWIASLLFAIAMVLRLARFNVALDEKNKPAWKRGFFVGVPAPAGAIAVLAPIYLELAGMPHYDQLAILVMIYTLFIAMLVVSSIPTYSGKTVGLRIPRAHVVPLIVGFVATIAMLFSYTWITMLVVVALYLISIPLARRAWHKANREMAEEATTNQNEINEQDDLKD